MDTCSAPRCCGGDGSCVFTQAIKAREADCACARRSDDAEGGVRIDCAAPEAQCACRALLSQVYAAVRAQLRWPGPRQPLRHQQALTLQTGTVEALRQLTASPSRDIAELARVMHERPGGWGSAPLPRIADELLAWTRRRRGP